MAAALAVDENAPAPDRPDPQPGDGDAKTALTASAISRLPAEVIQQYVETPPGISFVAFILPKSDIVHSGFSTFPILKPSQR